MEKDRGELAREFLQDFQSQQRASTMLANPFFALQTVEHQLQRIEETYKYRFREAGAPIVPQDKSFSGLRLIGPAVDGSAFEGKDWTRTKPEIEAKGGIGLGVGLGVFGFLSVALLLIWIL